MKCIFCLGLFIAIANASPFDEILLASCQGSGHALYNSCVVVPPVTPHQATACTALLAEYMTCSTTLNLPEPMLISRDPDPYSWSPYDPCRFEVQHQILWDICPSAAVGI